MDDLNQSRSALTSKIWIVVTILITNSETIYFKQTNEALALPQRNTHSQYYKCQTILTELRHSIFLLVSSVSLSNLTPVNQKLKKKAFHFRVWLTFSKPGRNIHLNPIVWKSNCLTVICCWACRHIHGRRKWFVRFSKTGMTTLPYASMQKCSAIQSWGFLRNGRRTNNGFPFGLNCSDFCGCLVTSLTTNRCE